MGFLYVPHGEGLRKAALDAYYEDNVVAAHDMLEGDVMHPSGQISDFYRTLEGEARTRQLSQRAELTDKLQFEWVATEIPHFVAVGHVIAEAAKRVTQRLGWDEREGVLTSIITQESNDMWTQAKAGYCVDKTPYDKICLPAATCLNPNTLFRVTSHEFAHVVVLNTTQKRAPHWLDEGIACLMEGRSAVGSKYHLQQNDAWKDVDHLERTFFADRQDPTRFNAVGAAYEQATVITAYLHSLKGDAGLVDLLDRLGHQPLMTELVNRVRSKDQADQPLHHVYGFGEAELFERAARWNPPADPIPAK